MIIDLKTTNSKAFDDKDKNERLENSSEQIDITPEGDDNYNINNNKDNRSRSSTSNSFFSCTSSIEDFDSFASTSPSSTSTSNLSRVVSESGISGKTMVVQVPFEEQIERDPLTEEQFYRIRKEIEEMEKQETKNNNANANTANVNDYAFNTNVSNELSRKKSKGRKEFVKVPLESGLPVALHPNETGKEGEEGGIVRDGEFGGDGAISTGAASTAAINIEDIDDNRLKTSPPGMEIVDEDHRNYILMYDMLTGIRTCVSRCQAKPARPLTSRDFKSSHKMAFDLTGNEETPSSRYDFKFKDYAPWVFRSLREQFSIDAADYLVSLTGKYVLSELYSPGKSGSLFYYSQDYRFIIKTIRESEHLFLRRILKHYHQHIQEQPNSLLVRFYGLHRVQLPLGKKIYFVVMGNLFPNDRPMRCIYDLKGSTHGRWNPDPADEKDAIMANSRSKRKGPGPTVLKDLNWLSRREKLVLGPLKATQLMNQLKIDCKFLAKLKIMDYSLLIGLHSLPESDQSDASLVDPLNDYIFYRDFNGGFQATFEDNSPGPEVYYLGIIDILTPYSLTKKLEHTFKSLVFPKDSISAVNPIDYAKRFLKFMASNILQNVGADYSRRRLPDPPEVDETSCQVSGVGDVLIIEEKKNEFEDG